MLVSAVATRYALAVDRYERTRTLLIEREQVATFDFVISRGDKARARKDDPHLHILIARVMGQTRALKHVPC